MKLKRDFARYQQNRQVSESASQRVGKAAGTDRKLASRSSSEDSRTRTSFRGDSFFAECSWMSSGRISAFSLETKRLNDEFNEQNRQVGFRFAEIAS
jgi:hypothetical protein